MYKIRGLVWKDYSNYHSMSENHSGYFYSISRDIDCPGIFLLVTIENKTGFLDSYTLNKVSSIREGKEKAWGHVKERILPALEKDQHALDLIKDMHPARVWDIARQYHTSPNQESENWEHILNWHREGCNQIDKIVNEFS